MNASDMSLEDGPSVVIKHFLALLSSFWAIFTCSTIKRTWKRRVLARSVQRDLYVKGYSSISKWSVVSWMGGSYIYMNRNRKYILNNDKQSYLSVGISQSYAFLTQICKNDHL